ncbi:hypothetical protein RJ639_007328 [Escallonia herrerae]|uniref:Exostosin GT47 domain-containing protein n=1 Tax=Escallonia herrerae TaxID=1293975 RepID=A0AA88VUV7_9ASTE|nr:hypothetical protein RJ639_007328 [Escallonia herrerae]
METKRLLWLMGLIFAMVLMVQYFELPYGNVLSSLFSGSKVQLPKVGSPLSGDLSQNTKGIGYPAPFDGLNSTGAMSTGDIANKTQINETMGIGFEDGVISEGNQEVNDDSLESDEEGDPVDGSPLEDLVEPSQNSNTDKGLAPDKARESALGFSPTNIAPTSENIGSIVPATFISVLSSSPSPSPSTSPAIMGTNLTAPPVAFDPNSSSSLDKYPNSTVHNSGIPGPLQGDLAPSNGNSSITAVPAVKERSESPTPAVLSISNMNDILLQSRAASHSMHATFLRALNKLCILFMTIPECIVLNLDVKCRSYELMEQTLKVYIYREGERPIFHLPVLKGIYASEGWFMKQLKTNKHYVTKNPRNAHLFYLPFSSRMLEETLYVPGSHSRKNLVQHLKNYLDMIVSRYPFWNRTGGADHFLVACHDWAPAETEKYLASCIRALCNSDIKEGFKLGKDVSLPETNVRTIQNPLKEVGGNPASKRPILAFFAGKMHGYVRPILLQQWENKDPDMKIVRRLPKSKNNKIYSQHMKSSKYCICAKGYEVNSPRVVEAIFFECVPVIISDNFVPPFFEILDWESFAVFVQEKDIPNLKSILLSISERSDGAFSPKPHGIHSMVVKIDNIEVMKECQTKHFELRSGSVRSPVLSSGKVLFFGKSYSPAGDLSNSGISTYAYSGLARKNNSEVPTLVKGTDPGDQGKDGGTRGDMVPEKTGSLDVNNFESFSNQSSVENSKEVANVETSISSAALEKGTEGNKSSPRDTTTKDKSLSSKENASSDSARESSFISVSPLGMASLTNLDAKSVAPMMSADLNASAVPKAAMSVHTKDEKPGPRQSAATGSIGNSSWKEIPPTNKTSKVPILPVMSISKMTELLLKSQSSHASDPPELSSVVDQELQYAKSEIENAPIVKNDTRLYSPLYRNLSMFRRSYELMDNMLKVYIYKEGEKPIFHQSILEGIYACEGWFLKLLEANKQFVTEDPGQAHLFYLPFSSRLLQLTRYVRNSHSRDNLIQYMKNYVDMLTSKYPFWNRTGGADHFLAACHDWAPAETRGRMLNCIRALCNADIRTGFAIGKDVSIPTTYIRSLQDPIKDIGGGPPSQRPILAFFAGYMHGYVRPILLKYWGKDPDMKIFSRMPHVKGNMNYIQHMKSSRYCICARGFAVNSPRVVESIFYECVPVIISDNYVPPLFEVLNWESFAVFILEEDIPNLKNILLSISDENYLEMQKRVRKVQEHFLWHAKPAKYDLFHMILHSIWYNRVFRVNST